MTVREIYRLALSKLFEKQNEDADFHDIFPSLLFTAELEAMDAENSIRLAAEKTLLTADEIVLLDEITDEDVPFDKRIAGNALPYGVASHYFADDMDTFKSVEYRNRFIDALSEYSRAVYTTVAQYGGADE